MPKFLVLCGDVAGSNDGAIRLALTGGRQNATLKVEEIGRRVVTNVPDLFADLLEIATYVYCADQAASRGGEVQQGMGTDWRRNFRFVIPVRSPDHWSSRDVMDQLCSTLWFLSEDEYEFQFDKVRSPVPFSNYLDYGPDDAFEPEEVVLFSGGLDSVSGVIEELSIDRKRVALVSHRSSSKILDGQKRIVAKLKERFPNYVMHVPVLATRHGTLAVQENTLRSRSFLYATLACVVARLFGNDRIRFFNNGVMSINLPISAQLVGARATRTTHPLSLKHLRKFLSVAIGSTFEVDNPLIWKIKPEVVQLMMGRDASGLIADTISCTNVRGITRQHTHCGCCLQCLDRRFSILAANAAEHDPIEMYRTELLAGARPKTLEQTLAESYVRTALELREMGEHAFFDRFSGETTRVCGGFPSLTSDEIGRNVLDLHQRHGRAIGEVLEAGVGRHRAELVNRNLPPSSVLMMTIAPDGAPALPPVDVRIHTDAIKTLIDEAGAETASKNQRGGGYAADQAQASLRNPSPRSHGKSRPARERARDAIDELYPAGVPGQATEPNANLFRRVGEKLKQAGLPGVSDATILRAAGRRK